MPLDNWGNLAKLDSLANEMLPLMRELLIEIQNAQSYAEYVLHDDDEFLRLDEQGEHVGNIIEDLKWFLHPAKRDEPRRK